LVATVPASILTYTDTITNVPFGEWYYYCVSYNGVSEYTRPTYGTTYINQAPFETDPFTDQSPYIFPSNSEMSDYIEEIKRRNLWLCEQNGEMVKLLKIRYSGTRCPLMDEESMQCPHPRGKPKGGSNACWGTGFIESYTDQLNIRVRIVNASRPIKINETGLTISSPTRMWTIWVPSINTGDIIVTQDNRRYEVVESSRSAVRGLVLHQEFSVELKPPSDIIYEIPITV
jgi:hypothetical protein